MTTTITCVCPLCGAVTHVACDVEAYSKYVNTNALIQDVFPNMDIHTRETLISGLCSACQDRFFVEEDDDCDDVCDLCSFQDECVGSDILV